MFGVTPPTALAFAAAVLLVAGITMPALSAHKTVLSPYTFHRDVAPILRSRCSSCHAEGRNSFALTTFTQVKERAGSIHRELLSGRMPIWYADARAASFKGSKAMTGKELNVLLMWAAGGTPEGLPVPDADRADAVSAPGAPDAVLEMPTPLTLSAERREVVHQVEWPARRLAGRWIRGADLWPGNPAIVRRASIEIRRGNVRQLVTHWVPGDTPEMFPGGGAFRVPSGATIVLTIYYTHPSGERVDASDRSRVALYLRRNDQVRQIGEIAVVGGGEWRFNETSVFTAPVVLPSRIVAIRPVTGAVDGRVELTVVSPIGRRTPLAVVVLRPEWPRRYIFDNPIFVEPGSRLEATVTPSYGISWNSLTGDRGVGPKDGGPLRLLVETLQ
jgi:hypothetical protein